MRKFTRASRTIRASNGTRERKHWEDHDISTIPKTILDVNLLHQPHEFVTFMDPAAAKRFLDRGESPNIAWARADNLTPLHIAASLGPASLVRKLLDHGAQTDAVDSHKRTPLHLAARAISFARISKSTNLPVVPDESEYYIKVLLIHRFNEDGDITERIRLLVTAGAKLNARDSMGRTPLVYALLSIIDSIAPAQALLEAGANVHVRYNSATPLLHDLPYMELALGGSTTAPDKIRWVLKALLGEGADIGGRDRLERTALHLAVELGCRATVKALLDMGAGVHACVGENANTPLHLAVQLQLPGGICFEICELLLAAGADPTRRNGCDETPISLAVKYDDRILNSLTLPQPGNMPRLMRYMEQLRKENETQPGLRSVNLKYLRGLYLHIRCFPSDPEIQSYEIQKPTALLSGRGGYGECYRGTFLGLFEVALKCIRVPQVGGDQSPAVKLRKV
ncbi:hypothetical protein BOTBODRAFT_141552 [Botryobasidium botryosum FD-172 SS1]|uniref:Uncharacterized protein n=1 Tax=Botryobasidium botryosum (strain FD-172 SS1) TaxID=930990 RepID=A0A067N2S6_BOTB1|nr:hypothetical protein BOTBODRAFT_141552 [Botryobasidium botryosum FD-172 SS1]